MGAELEQLSDITGGIKEKLGLNGEATDKIAAPAQAGAIADPGASVGNETGGGLKNTTDAVASGGTRNTSINISFKNLIEQIVFDGSLADKRADLEQEVTSAVMRVLAMAQASG